MDQPRPGAAGGRDDPGSAAASEADRDRPRRPRLRAGRGLPELREAVAAHYNRLYRRGMPSQYTAENVAIAAGGRLALSRVGAAMDRVYQDKGECAFLQLPDRSDFTIALYARRDASRSETPHWFLLIDVDDIESAIEHLRAAGVDVEDIQSVPFGRAAKFTDPEGNILEVHESIKHR